VINPWNQKSHAHKWIILPKNMGSKLCIDETALPNEEL
jgi:hypothetical protein